MSYIYLVLAFITNAAANVLLKVGATRDLSTTLPFPETLAYHAPILAGVGLFVVNIGFYYLALRALPLSIAYPIMVGMSFLLASIAAVLFLREPYGWQLLAGYAIILIGIAIVVSYAK